MNNSLPQSLQNRDLDRLRSYRENLDFYDGIQWVPPDSSGGRRRERRLTFNYAKVFIDKITSYLMSSVSFVVEPSEDAAPSS